MFFRNFKNGDTTQLVVLWKKLPKQFLCFLYIKFTLHQKKTMLNLKTSKISSNEPSSKFRVQKLHFTIAVTEDPPAKPNKNFKQKIILTSKCFTHFSAAKTSPYKWCCLKLLDKNKTRAAWFFLKDKTLLFKK